MTLAQARQLKARTGMVETATRYEAGAAIPDSVAGGYKLRDPGYWIDDYNYRSDYGWLTDNVCDPNCTPITKLKVRIHFGLNGPKWSFFFDEVVLQQGPLSWTYRYIYHCAININNRLDNYCGGGGADPGEEGIWEPKETLAKFFQASTKEKIEYAMIGVTAEFSTGDSATLKFRGPDVCVSGSTRLCAGFGGTK